MDAVLWTLERSASVMFSAIDRNITIPSDTALGGDLAMLLRTAGGELKWTASPLIFRFRWYAG